MKVVEILLPVSKKGALSREISPRTARQIDMLKKRMDSYADKIADPNTSSAGREFLKSKLKDDYDELKSLLPKFHAVAEAVHKLPLTIEDFNLLKELMEKPIPAAIAPIYIQEVIHDDELNDQILSLEDTQPGLDIRPLIAEWIDRVMPDQKYRFVGTDLHNHNRSEGLLSPIHGYDPHMYKGTNDPVTGNNAYGRT